MFVLGRSVSSRKRAGTIAPELIRHLAHTGHLAAGIDRSPELRPLAAFVAFYRDGDVPLTGLPAGTYDCQVTVLDPVSSRAAFWRAPIVLR